MEVIFRDFKQAQLIGSGPLLSTTLSPIPPPTDPDRLSNFYRGSNSFSIQSDIRYGILHHANTDIRFSKPEGNAWVDVYVAYWKATGELLAVEDHPPKGNWTNVYIAWREVANALIKGYSATLFPSWTLPCLYVVGRYLRIFAIKADSQARAKGGLTFSAGLQEDAMGDFGKNENLEDAARVINRIFQLCISDRYVMIIKRRFGSASCCIGAESALLGHLWRNQENGVSTTPQTSCLRRTSRSNSSLQQLDQCTVLILFSIHSSMPSVYRRIFSRHCRHQEQTCRLSKHSQNHTL